MPRFVAIPIQIEAFQYDGHISLMPDSFRMTLLRHLNDGTIEIRTGDGARSCKYGDWIVHGPDGLFSVMRNATFEAMFTPHVAEVAAERSKRVMADALAEMDKLTPQPAPPIPAAAPRRKANV